MKKKTKWVIGTLILFVAGTTIVLKSCRQEKQVATFETVTAARGDISNVVTATGSIAAIKTVDVGTQVSGVVSKIYVDYNSHVKKGQLLAEIDRASLLSTLESCQAALDDSKANLTFQTSTYKRTKALFDKNLIAKSDYDQALYNYEKAMADLKTSKSNYSRARVNLAYAYIYSPIDGVVLSRAVDEGQTVAASFSTPTLFSIANDLTQMQVEANVDEADIGQVKEGQHVSFTVDAFPDMKFSGTVTQIRLKATTTNNVVTYTVIIHAPNPEKKLMPGLTANISIEISKASNVLTVPAKALRFTPDNDLLQTYYKSLPESEQHKMKPNTQIQTASLGNTQVQPLVWVKKGVSVNSVPVTIGISDGINTEITSGLKEGDEVITSMTAASGTSAQSTGSSPFMPKRPKSSKDKKSNNGGGPRP
ncbi:MAG: efflux RND transporter periplasmic adaptor subunit [Bacteroidota bacterium]|nr:efflux RND transporter periplasmic adaptor subunit [Bacteroidota bacterium]